MCTVNIGAMYFASLLRNGIDDIYKNEISNHRFSYSDRSTQIYQFMINETSSAMTSQPEGNKSFLIF